MKNGLFKKLLSAALCTLALGSTAALAEPDTFGLGTGRNGTLTVSTAGTNWINSYAPVTGPLASGDTVIPVGTCTGEASCFAAGDLVLVLQTTGLVPEPASGDTTLLDLNTRYKEVGRWEFARLASVTPTAMTLTAPLVYDYAANVTQVIRVPEYTGVTINATRSITAPSWNGSTGGVIAFLAQQTFTNNGTVNANSIGFRGGRFVDDGSGDAGCLETELDKSAPQGAQKGEGLAFTRYGDTHTGRGNVANGGGGGVCSKSGGGGGGNGGAGGNGGNSGDGNRPVGGLGGAAVDGTFFARLTLGGGGGAGHGDSGSNVTGGRGGGIVFIRANQLTGTGSISSGGESVSVAASDASSGGGAGGTLYLRFATSAACNANSVSARGGIGGNSGLVQVGPGGGGGGGRILFQSASGTCNIGLSNVNGAAAGTQQDTGAPGGGTYGAQQGAVGVFGRLNTGFPVSLPAPTVSEPANNTSTSNRRPDIRGTAQPNSTVVIYLDGVEVGRTTSNSSGTYVFSPPADLAEKTYTVQAAIEVDGVQSPKSAANTFTVDVTKPDTSIVTGPPASTNATSATFDFNASETGVRYECSLNGAPFTSCQDPETFSGLTERSHTLQVRAIDAAGNVDDTPASHTWTVDLTAPNTRIVANPPSRTNATSATFDFDVEVAEAGVTYECRLDGGAFAACTDPVTFNGLTEKSYTLEVRAVDALGNVDPSPASYTWMVDLTPPNTVIVSGPPNRTNATSATFDFDVEVADVGVTYECNLDGAGFTACTDPVTFTGLTEKSYTLEVRARDGAGNVDLTPASYTWTVDLTPPDTTIVSGPPASTSSTSAAFDFSSEAGATYVCRLEGAMSFTPCSDPETFTGLGDGEHRLEVSAVDVAGNMDPTPAVYTWTVDTAPPDTTIVSGPVLLGNSPDATFDFSAEVGATFECSLDGGAFVACTDPVTFTGLGQGDHTLQVRARDAAGNVDPTPASYTWTVDLTPPVAPGVASPEQNGIVDTLTPAITGSAEPNSTVTIIIDGQVVGTVQTDAAGNWSYTPTTPLTTGPHQVQVSATDEAGNVSTTTDPRDFTIVQDTSAPETTITSGPSGTTSERSATFTLESNEPGVTFECSLDGGAYMPCTSPVTFSDLAEGEHTLQVRARDAAGNVDATPATRTWTVSGGDIAFLGDGVGCSATGGDASLLVLGLGTFLTLARRRRRS
ncbi:adventurous gliding motility protein AgmC [Archangium lansingense]|uniref:Ig-like domain-containing protein n=1 Tax=Archangium lansingense TaxID=2995310 RepID=A0ABT3ZWR7_9BACT|nr:Ig-like domain-containing protein [Archangium lansinium]MCY1073847.1 Ig-like domain-containing protein [Archangium lansinium]